jgi:hypothetical protein
MPLAAGLRPSLEKPLSDFLLLLSGYHLHDGQRELQDPGLGFPPGKRSDRDSFPIRERIRNRLKFLAVNADSLGLRVSHFLEPITDFMEFNRGLAGD